MQTNLIISGASPAYEPSILALAGSLRANWPNHPPLLVYDLGVSGDCVKKLSKAGVEVKKVPDFCPHWRKYFTWKLWCFQDAPCKNYLWLDAGMCVLRPLDEVFQVIDSFGYFAPTNHWPLKPTLSSTKQRAVGIADERVIDEASIASGIHGFRKDPKGIKLLEEAFEIACVESNMLPTDVWDRHDQALLSAMLLKHFGKIHYSDHRLYCNSTSPTDVVGQRIWVHRRRMSATDLAEFERRLYLEPASYTPTPLPQKKADGFVRKLRLKFAKLRGRLPPSDRAGECIYDGVRD